MSPLFVILDDAPGLPCQGLLQRAPARRGVEVVTFGKGEPRRAAQRQRAFAGQQHMRRVVHDRPRRQDRVLGSEDAGHRAGAVFAPFHDRRVHFLGPGRSKDGAAPGVQQRIVLERDDRGRDGVERAAAGGEDASAGAQRLAQPGMVERAARRAHRIAAEGSGAAMDREGEFGSHHRERSVIVS